VKLVPFPFVMNSDFLQPSVAAFPFVMNSDFFAAFRRRLPVS
jgi:hypothetical protein